MKAAFGERLQEHIPLERFTAARIGGPADFLLEVTSADELAQAASLLWELELPFVVLGGGSNVLVSDAGVREVVILNRARRVHFDEQATPPTAWAESGANFGTLARQAARRGLAGLEWAAGIPALSVERWLGMPAPTAAMPPAICCWQKSCIILVRLAVPPSFARFGRLRRWTLLIETAF